MGNNPNNSKNSSWFFGEEAKKRFEKYKGTHETLIRCYKENAVEDTFTIAFSELVEGNTYHLKTHRREFDESFEGDNILMFVDEYIEALCRENNTNNKLKTGFIHWQRTYYYLLTLISSCLLEWEPSDGRGPNPPILLYPDGLKLPENQIINLLLTIYKSDVELNYSEETIKALHCLIDMVADHCTERLDLIEPQIFDVEFYEDVEYSDEFKNRLLVVVDRHKV